MQSDNQPGAFASGPPLYSARAVRGFSMLFSAIVGGVLMAQNLKDVGQPKAARTALWASIAYTIAAIWLLAFVPATSSSSIFPVVLGYIGSLGLEMYAKKFIPNRSDFPAKSIVKPLLICLAIVVPTLLLIFYSLTHPAA
jgi:hypothetical protein